MAEPAEAPSGAFDFVAMEHTILDFWSRGDLFRKSLEHTHDKKPYIFYDGPPFATGLPHHGHLVSSTIKDIVPRYWTMKGRYVLRRFGWDCHGLPIEHEIDKQLGISAAEVVAQLGVAGYNDECRKIVQRYVAQWRRPSRGSAAGSTSTTTTRPWTPGTWSPSGGSSSSSGTRG